MKNRGTNASASDFGWDFQHHAGIIMILANLEKAKAIRIEGNKEDIEITLANDKKIFAQAKSADKPELDRNKIAKFKKSLRTLYNASRVESAEEVVFITNNPNPLDASSAESLQLFAGDESVVHFDDLTDELKDKIKDFCAELRLDFPLDHFKIWTFFFRGSEPNRYRVVRRAVREFIDSLEVDSRGISVERLYRRWHQDFVLNASTTQTSVVITKESVLWPVIAWMCELGREERECAELDDGTFEEINRLYKKIIDDKSENFTLVNKVVSEFKSYRGNSVIATKSDVKSFANLRWRDYLAEFDFGDTEEEIQKFVVVMALSNIIRTRYTVNRIKKRFAL